MRKVRKICREINRIKKEDKNYQERLQNAYGELFRIAEMVLSRTQELLDDAMQTTPKDTEGLLAAAEAAVLLDELVYWHAATTHVCNTAW